jgi:pimeloyl-ACP methyl ester carboxylesterase
VLGLLGSPFEATAQGTPPTPTPPDSTERGGRPSTKQLLRQLGGAPCPDDSAFTCVTLTVPVDHFDATNPGTLNVVFAVLPASGERFGMFVTATGGPGSSGVAAADFYTSYFDPRITEHYDIVFFDQRGIALSGGLTCPDAAAAYYRSESRSETPQQEAALVAAARDFSTTCVAEMGSPANLAFYGTEQAVEDLDLLREALRTPKIHLYGESYGTQYAQTYAAAHPDHLAALFLDGVVDLTVSQIDYYAQQAQAFNDTVVATLQACALDADCAEDYSVDPVDAYDTLAARLKRNPQTVRFYLPDGRQNRAFTFGDLETVAASQAYGEGDRAIFARGLAYANRGDLGYLLRLLYIDLGIDPITLDAIPDPTYSDAMYYGVECQDYGDFSGSPDERATQYLRVGDAVEAGIPRLTSIFYGDLPCSFWPDSAQGLARPAPLTGEGYTTFVLGATADPATPYHQGVDVYSRVVDGYLITQTGGPHVIFGRGVECVDSLVANYLADGSVPAQRETTCEGEVMSGYVPLPPVNARSFADVLDALISFKTEVGVWPEVYYWDGVEADAAGCGVRGSLGFEARGNRTLYTFTNCAFTSNFIVSGEGAYNANRDRFTLDVHTNGNERCDLNYTREGDLHKVTGTCNGRRVRLER